MAQLVARFHGMEEVGGSNPPSSTEITDTQLVSVGFLLLREPCGRFLFSGLLAAALLNFGLRVKMCVWLGVSRGLDLAFLNAD